MSHAVSFDTLAYARKLKEAGIPEKQAEAQSAALSEIFDYQAATKKDLQDAELRLISQFEIKISEMKSEIIKWVVGLFFAQSALIISFLKIFHG
ncbi:MAG: hypothetical protein K0R24_2286 [Gammaproteobacteria bacterium]|jgi:hypothetical protein|nr:hypothetical protein [Gammaproteobacteria bacterium]MCE3239305.1 hypothetical protein [Gammaproteobacteria bacterium]